MTTTLRIKRHIAVPMLAIGAMALLAMPAAGASTKPPLPPTKVGVATSVPLTSTIKSASFLNQAGKPVTLESLKGKTVFLVPLLTLCTDTCPFTSGNLLQLYAKLGAANDKNVVIVTIAVDPYRDTVKRIAAYAKIIDAKFQMWTENATTSKPVPPPNLSGKNSVGTGDTNATLTAFEKFFGWTVQVVKEDTPASVDWMAPYEKLTYDINHSDGFWIISPSQVVRFESGNAPQFHGTLATALAKFIDANGQYTYKHPTPGGWTPAQAVAALSYVDGKIL
jgi:protein SCO1/2